MTAVHQILELALGTGVISQDRLGLPGAVAASVALDGGWVAAALGRRRHDRLLAYLSGVAVGVPAIHFTLWPWTTRRGMPVLTEAEGLPSGMMPLYNAVLYGWAVAGALAAARETPRRALPWAAAGFASIVAFRPVARRHFQWIRREAARNPQWWNRAWSGA
jgi:hypothetical protein